MSEPLSPVELAFVKPFYLKMMRSKALIVPDDLWDQVVDAGRVVTVADVNFMLRSENWRPVLMGAWFSLAPVGSIVDDLIAAMSASRGSLTAPPLAAAATLLAGAAAVPAMMNYIDFITDPRRRDGSEAVVAAAVEHLGRDAAITVTDHARTMFVDLYNVASRLRQTWQQPEPPGSTI
jgi:hypothetical protein